MAKCDHEDYDLSKDQDMSCDTAVGLRNVTHTLTLVRVHEAILEATMLLNSIDVETANGCMKVFVKRQMMLELTKNIDRKVMAGFASERLDSQDGAHQAQLLDLLLRDQRPSLAAGLAVLRCKPSFVKYVAQSLLECLVNSTSSTAPLSLPYLQVVIATAVTELHRGPGRSLVPRAYEEKKEKTKSLRLLLIDCVHATMSGMAKLHPGAFTDLVQGWPASVLKEDDRWERKGDIRPFTLTADSTAVIPALAQSLPLIPERNSLESTRVAAVADGNCPTLVCTLAASTARPRLLSGYV